MANARPKLIPLKAWKSKQTRGFVTHRDSTRQLLVAEHPWRPSRAGGFGEWKVTVTPPAGWRAGEPLFVSFYQSDNYSGTWHEDAWTGTQAFIGHRFKQLLVNGRLVWEQDVADEEMVDPRSQSAGPGWPGYHDPYRVVEITNAVASEIVLTFRVVDKVASTTHLPGDTYKRFSWSVFNPHDAVKNFQTSAYFGDVYLTASHQAVRPEEQSVPIRRRKSRRRALPKTGLPFSLVTSGRLPSPGYPVRTGVPMPRGSVSPDTTFALRDPQGQSIPSVSTEISHWPDGSVRWLLCEFIATRNGRYRLMPDAEPARPAQPVRVRTRNGITTVTNGAMTLRVGQQTGAGVFDGIACASGLDVGRIDLSIKLNRVGWRDHFTAQRRCVVIERTSPLCAVVRLDGDMLDEKGQRFGPWRVRLHVWAGLPYLLVDWRLVNESDQAMAMLLDWSARVRLPGLENATVDFGPFTPGHDPDDIGVKAMGHHGTIEQARAIPLYRDAEVSCRQERADEARIYRNTSWVATTGQAAGFINLRHADGGVVGAMRWFAEEFPTGIIVRPDLLSLATLPEGQDALSWPHDRPSARIGRGEAKRQTFALWLHDGTVSSHEAERFNRCVQDAPRLFNQSWFIASGVVETGPPRHTPGLAAWAERMTPVIERTGIRAPRLGHREYWDTAWSNDYRGRTHLGLIQYIETGSPQWFRYFDAACTHTREVDIIHFCPEHPDWAGATHSYGEDHTSCGPMGNIGLNCDGLLDHYLITGDPDSLDAAKGLAEHLLDCDPWGRSARNVGWPLAQVIRWYDQTGDPRFLAKARDLMEAVRVYVEPRRGIFDEIHGCWNYRGAVPFMTGYLAFGLIRYHQCTAAAEALNLMRLIAAGLFAESRTARGRFRYSPFPEINYPTDRFRSWNALVGGLVG
ncbi:MAG: hypothetical protein HY710_04260, partial [Candidatus Latescibacteria bacterium]|nr:hypothetical protein [Candidatus Latescibacterota bacterium]